VDAADCLPGLKCGRAIIGDIAKHLTIVFSRIGLVEGVRKNTVPQARDVKNSRKPAI
jgi:hypothetical protein